MNQKFNTKKLYYGFPILIIGYKDSKYGYNITTISSSYTLGDMMVIGMVESSNASQQIQKSKRFSVNLSTEAMMKIVENAGFISGEDKLETLGVNYQVLPETDTPMILESPVVIECEVMDSVLNQGYINFVARIINRYVDEKLLKNDGTLDNEKISPVYFVGDSSKRIYKYLDDDKKGILGEYLNKK